MCDISKPEDEYYYENVVGTVLELGNSTVKYINTCASLYSDWPKIMCKIVKLETFAPCDKI